MKSKLKTNQLNQQYLTQFKSVVNKINILHKITINITTLKMLLFLRL